MRIFGMFVKASADNTSETKSIYVKFAWEKIAVKETTSLGFCPSEIL